MSDEQDGRTDDLLTKVSGWLNEEGYPVEFETAAAFERNGFNVWQGHYVRHESDESKREVDVVASLDHQRTDGLPHIRVEHVVECKWSGDKPWVLFCGGRGMTPEACIAQSIGNDLGHTVLWKEAGQERLTELAMFEHRAMPAFAGRQAFSKSKDIVFDAVRAVVGHAVATARRYDDPGAGMVGRLSEFAVMVRPVLVVDGAILEAKHVPDEGITLSEANASRLQWRGADRHDYAHATIDVVRLSHLDTFLAQRKRETDVLLEVMKEGADELVARNESGSLKDLQVTAGSRGMRGRPTYLRRLLDAQDLKRSLEPPDTSEPTSGDR